MIKPEFWTDEKIIELPIPGRLLFIGLLNFADDEGIFRNSPKSIKCEVFPADMEPSANDVKDYLELMQNLKLIVKGEDVEGNEQAEHGVGTPMGNTSALKSEGEGDDDEEYEVDESLFREQDEEDEEDEIEENNDVSSGIGGGDNKQPANNANDDSTEDPGDSTDVEALGEELKEYKSAVRFLKDKLHEVNILNAKLLFTNKLFKEFALDNNQKLKVVETFDRTQSTREIKLVYSTLAEQFGDNGSIAKRNPIKESASAKSGSTKPSKESRKVISEEDNVASRFRKLAGIING